MANENSDPPVANNPECDPPVEFSLVGIDSFDGITRCFGYYVFTEPVIDTLPPWVIYLNEQATINRKGRFYEVYRRNQ